MGAVRIAPQFLDEVRPFGADAADVEPIHRREIGRVEARAQDRVVLRLAGRLVDRPALDEGEGVAHESFLGVKLTS